MQFTLALIQIVTALLMASATLDVKMEDAKESDYLRDERIFGTNNGATLQTRVIKNKKEYKRKKKVNLAES